MLVPDWFAQRGFRVRDAWSRLTSRDRYFLVGGTVIVSLLLAYQFIFSPLLDRMQVLDRLIEQKQGDLTQLTGMREEYLDIQQRIRSIEQQISHRQEGFSLLSYVEGIAVDHQVKKNIVFIRPQPAQVVGGFREVAVEVKVEDLTLAQTVQLLSAIQQAPEWLRIKRLHLKKQYDNPRRLNGTFIVASYEKVA